MADEPTAIRHPKYGKAHRPVRQYDAIRGVIESSACHFGYAFTERVPLPHLLAHDEGDPMTYELHEHENSDGGTDRYVPFDAFSVAIDEIYALRAALAYEAAAMTAHLDYKTFPKSRRRYAEDMVQRARAAARGERGAYRDVERHSQKVALRMAGADDCLTNAAWWDGYEAAQEVSGER